jgi:hypothetical protein
VREKVEELNEEIQGEEEHAQEHQEGAKGKAALRELNNGVNEAGRNDDQAGFTTAFVKRAGGNIAREISTKKRDFAFYPNGKLLAMTPEIDGARQENKIPKAGEQTEGWSGTPIKHETSKLSYRECEFRPLRGWWQVE